MIVTNIKHFLCAGHSSLCVCIHVWTYMYVYVNEHTYSFNAHSDPDVGTIINPTFLDEETEVQRGKVMCLSATQLISNNKEIQAWGEVRWGRG